MTGRAGGVRQAGRFGGPRSLGRVVCVSAGAMLRLPPGPGEDLLLATPVTVPPGPEWPGLARWIAGSGRGVTVILTGPGPDVAVTGSQVGPGLQAVPDGPGLAAELAPLLAAGPGLRLALPRLAAPAGFLRVAAALAAAGQEAGARPTLGLLVDGPVTAMTAGDFPAGFVLIDGDALLARCFAPDPGTSDPDAGPGHPAYLELLGRAIAAARGLGVRSVLTGRLAGDAEWTARLLALGLDAVAPAG